MVTLQTLIISSATILFLAVLVFDSIDLVADIK